MTLTLTRREGVAVVENCGHNFTIAIPSRKRAARLYKNPLLPLANICVHESEYDDYAAEFQRQGIAPGGLHAHNQHGLGNIRNWMLDNLYDQDSEAWQLQYDDDFGGMMYLMTARSFRVNADPQYIIDVATHTGLLAGELPTQVFGWANTPVPQERRSYIPYRLRAWVMAASMGIIGDLRFDPKLRISVDIDICLQAMAKHRIVVQDMRYYGWCDETGNKTGADPGGLAGMRTDALVTETVEYLQTKWGDEIITRAGRQRGSGFKVKVNLS